MDDKKRLHSLDKISDEELHKKDPEAYWLRRLKEKYEPYLSRQDKGKGGIFSTTTRGHLLGITVKGRKIRGKTYDFRYDVRKTVRTALVDLQLFIETASEKDLNEVLNRETLQGVVFALLCPPRYRSIESGSRAKLAYLFVESGLNYFTENSKYIIENQKRLMKDAIDSSRQLTLLEVPEEERGDIL
jgi:hypothetical protein